MPKSSAERADEHKARLMVCRCAVLGLDHHLLEARDGIPPGYHWDIRPPLAPQNKRVYIETQPRDPESALEVLAAEWYLELEPERNGKLRWPQ